MTSLPALYARFEKLLREVAKFGIVGAVSYVIDTGLFNVFRLGVQLGPLTSKTLSVIVATTVAYFGNRYWTFRHRERSGLAREYLLFFVLNGVGLAIALACLATSHYLLGLRSTLADNISANVIGLILGTIFRFWSYRKWVFLDAEPVPVTVSGSDAPSRTSSAR